MHYVSSGGAGPARRGQPVRAATIWLAQRPALWIGAAAIAGLLVYWPFTVQDGYIVARYAENWVTRGELVFNAGERVSALTSPLHVMLEAALFWISGHTLLGYKALGVLLWAGTAWLVWRARAGDSLGQAWTLIILGLTPPLLMWTVAGLETPILSALAAGLAYVALLPGRPGLGRVALAGALCGLACLTRYDAILFAGPALGQVLLARRSPQAALLGGGVAAWLLAAWLLFAWRYFGDILPTSFYVKTPGLSLLKVGANAAYIVQWLVLVGVIPVLVMTWIGQAQRAAWYDLAPQLMRARWGLFLGLGLMLIYGLSVAQTHMMFSFRFFAPYLPALLLALGDAPGRIVAQLVPAAATLWRRRYAWALGWLALAQVGQLVYTYRASLNGVSLLGEFRQEGMRSYAREWTPLLGSLASEIQAHWAQQATSAERPPRIFTFAGGSLPYAYREAYFYEILVSYRHTCQVDGRESADYTLLLYPRRGPIPDQLPYPPSAYTLVADHAILFDGSQERLLVAFNPAPAPPRLPPRVNGPCLPAPIALSDGRR